MTTASRLHHPPSLLIFALANAGGIIGFLPLLTLLLPIKIEEVAPDARITLVTVTTLVGAVAASVSSIVFGWLSDRSVARGGGRRRVIAGGLVGTALSYGLIVGSTTAGGIIAAVIVFQIALNAVLGPYLAVMADEIPDDRKGEAGGLLALAAPMASAVSAAVVIPGLFGEATRFAIVAAAMILCTLPLLLLRPGAPLPPAPVAEVRTLLRHDLIAAWAARLMAQVAGGVLFYYLLYYFESVTGQTPGHQLAGSVGHLMTVAYVVPLPIAVLLGRVSDRTGRRKPALVGSALVAAAGLVGMAVAGDWTAAAIAFTAYAIGSSTFLALHSTFAMQLLPTPANRGRDLGLLNLTNTIPSMIGPLLAWALASPDDFSPLMLTLAVLTALAGVAILGVRGRR